MKNLVKFFKPSKSKNCTLWRHSKVQNFTEEVLKSIGETLCQCFFINAFIWNHEENISDDCEIS